MSALASQVNWNEEGLAPAVVSHAATGAVLMLGWMDREALDATMASGLCHFHSRSRGRLWKKGESSGNTLTVREVRLDCDGDALLVIADPAGPTCHTGEASCFYRRASGDDWAEDKGPRGAPAAVVDRVFAVIQSRRHAPPTKSYTASILAGGLEMAASRIADEQVELTDELVGGSDPAKVIHETADLLFHVLIGLTAYGVPVAEVWQELERRFGIGGLVEKAGRR